MSLERLEARDRAAASPKVLDEDLADVTPAMQIGAVKRELALRLNTYPKWVAAGRLEQADADRELRAMRAVLATLFHVFGDSE
jgi:hypothetical protein